jgi:hypothetical protein
VTPHLCHLCRQTENIILVGPDCRIHRCQRRVVGRGLND